MNHNTLMVWAKKEYMLISPAFNPPGQIGFHVWVRVRLLIPVLAVLVHTKLHKEIKVSHATDENIDSVVRMRPVAKEL